MIHYIIKMLKYNILVKYNIMKDKHILAFRNI